MHVIPAQHPLVTLHVVVFGLQPPAQTALASLVRCLLSIRHRRLHRHLVVGGDAVTAFWLTSLGLFSHMKGLTTSHT